MHKQIKENLESNKLDKIYLFGYGSLLWKVEFNYTRKLFGYVKGYVRHFWLLSDDHRGTPEKPGRVATLVKSNKAENCPEDDRVYGVAYEININEMDATFEYLNFREKCGYTLNEVVFYPSSGSAENQTNGLKCVCYFANPDNSYYSPNLTLDQMALHIYQSRGPSGPNTEYLYRLCESLKMLAKLENATLKKEEDDKKDEDIFTREILTYDKHLFELEALVKSLENNVSLNYENNNGNSLSVKKIHSF